MSVSQSASGSAKPQQSNNKAAAEPAAARTSMSARSNCLDRPPSWLSLHISAMLCAGSVVSSNVQPLSAAAATTGDASGTHTDHVSHHTRWGPFRGERMQLRLQVAMQCRASKPLSWSLFPSVLQTSRSQLSGCPELAHADAPLAATNSCIRVLSKSLLYSSIQHHTSCCAGSICSAPAAQPGTGSSSTSCE